jgi:hypothetical protein
VRLITAPPVSTAVKTPSDITTLLPYGMRRGSTAQWPTRKRTPVEHLCCRVFESEPRPPLAQYTVTRASIDGSRCSTSGRVRAETGGTSNRASPVAVRHRFILVIRAGAAPLLLRQNVPESEPCHTA